MVRLGGGVVVVEAVVVVLGKYVTFDVCNVNWSMIPCWKLQIIAFENLFKSCARHPCI